jgi:DnaJ like chaperone protein
MKWTGKLVGGALGLVTLGGFGALIGVLLGHQFDEFGAAAGPRRRDGAGAARGDNGGARRVLIGEQFFISTFQVMGHVAKSDGRVSEADIAAARAVMADLSLSPEQVQHAIAHYTRGKQTDFDLDAAVLNLRRACADRPELLGFYIELQLRAALAAADLHGEPRRVLNRVARLLAVSEIELLHMEAVLRIQRSHGRQRQSGPNAGTSGAVRGTGLRLAEAYEILEVPASASDEEVSKAYRRQLSKHHPDKLKANGLPESMLEHAKQRTQQIIEAHDLIRSNRAPS